MKELNVGDIVTIDGDSSFCDRNKSKIKKIVIRFDKKTGEEYKAYRVDNQYFDGRNGFSITPPLAYYIEELLQK